MAKRVWQIVGRVFPKCGMISQAIAYCVFLAFFPMLLLAVRIASIWIGSKAAALDAIRNVTEFLPREAMRLWRTFWNMAGHRCGSTRWWGQRGRCWADRRR